MLNRKREEGGKKKKKKSKEKKSPALRMERLFEPFLRNLHSSASSCSFLLCTKKLLRYYLYSSNSSNFDRSIYIGRNIKLEFLKYETIYPLFVSSNLNIFDSSLSLQNVW